MGPIDKSLIKQLELLKKINVLEYLSKLRLLKCILLACKFGREAMPFVLKVGEKQKSQKNNSIT
jgi:hypothetical protein